MPRRNYRRAKPGQPYAIAWPEWHVTCAEGGCEEDEVLAGLGEARTERQAVKQGTANLEKRGWGRHNGLWYCPKHRGA